MIAEPFKPTTVVYDGMLDVGEKAPEFELPNQDGDAVSLAEFTGERVVVYFYPRANTEGCTTEACGFRDSWDEFS